MAVRRLFTAAHLQGGGERDRDIWHHCAAMVTGALDVEMIRFWCKEKDMRSLAGQRSHHVRTTERGEVVGIMRLDSLQHGVGKHKIHLIRVNLRGCEGTRAHTRPNARTHMHTHTHTRSARTDEGASVCFFVLAWHGMRGFLFFAMNHTNSHLSKSQ